ACGDEGSTSGDTTSTSTSGTGGTASTSTGGKTSTGTGGHNTGDGGPARGARARAASPGGGGGRTRGGGGGAGGGGGGAGGRGGCQQHHHDELDHHDDELDHDQHQHRRPGSAQGLPDPAGEPQLVRHQGQRERALSQPASHHGGACGAVLQPAGPPPERAQL